MSLTTFLAIAWIAIMVFDLVVVLYWNKMFRELFDYWFDKVLEFPQGDENKRKDETK